MIRDESEEHPQLSDQSGEEVDPDAGPAYPPEQTEIDSQRNQAEG